MTNEQAENLKQFARFLIRELAWEGSEDGEIVQEAAVKHGLIQRAPGGYDPKKHGEGLDFDPGDELFEFADWMQSKPEDKL